MEGRKLIVAGAISNRENEIEPVLDNIKRICTLFDDVKCIFVESDSTDSTYRVLQQACINKNINADCHTLGCLRYKFPHRTGRIAAARNFYLDQVEENYSDYDYLLVIDFNEANTEPIDLDCVLSNFKYNNWDMICANQAQIYYDLWALRHPIWMPFDCWDHRNAPDYMSFNEKHNYCVRSRFKHIPYDMELIEVESAFGGTAFIKISSIKNARHESLTEEGRETCEWISFCKKINNGVSKIYINPGFINQRRLSRHAQI